MGLKEWMKADPSHEISKKQAIRNFFPEVASLERVIYRNELVFYAYFANKTLLAVDVIKDWKIT